MLAEYDVNMAKVVRNVVIIMKRPDNVDITKCDPCWQTAPITNETMSNDDILARIIGCINCENNITVITMVIREQHFHTSVLCRKRKQKKINKYKIKWTRMTFLSFGRDFIALELECCVSVIHLLAQITSTSTTPANHNNKSNDHSLPKAK